MANTPVVVLDDTMTSIANAIRSKTGGSATMTPGQMPAQIASIPTGGGVGIPREVDQNGVYQPPRQSFTFSLPSGATQMSLYAMAYAFYGALGLTSADLSSLKYLDNGQSLYYAFYNCTSLTTVSFSNLETTRGVQVMERCFDGCTSLTSVSFPKLATISSNRAMSRCFNGCTSLSSLSFPSLSNVGGMYNTQFSYMLAGCSNVTVHFPAAIQSTIGSWSDVTSGFGGTNTTVLFDL